VRANARHQSRFAAGHGEKRLLCEGEFFWGADVLPGWAKEERRAVKYSLAQHK